MEHSRRIGLKTLALVPLVILANTAGNGALNWGLKHGAPELSLAPSTVFRLLLSPWVSAGIALLILWMLLRMALLSWADLSYVLPVTASGYVLIALMSQYLFHERIAPRRWAGTLLIMAGVALVGPAHASTAASRR